MRLMPLYLIAFGGAALAVWEFMPLHVVVREGRTPVTVQRVAAFWPLSSVRVQSRKTLAEAQALSRLRFDPKAAHGGLTIEPYRDGAIELSIPWERRTSPCGRELSWSAWEAIAVFAEDQAGKRYWAVVDLRNAVTPSGSLVVQYVALEAMDPHEGV